MQRAFLHIGTHKTATTFLQQWLLENEAALAAQSIVIPRSGRMPGRAMHRSLPADLRREGTLWTELGREIGDIDGNIVLSCEMFATNLADEAYKHRLMERFSAFGFEVTFVIFVRDQPAYLNSRYNQDVKRFHTHQSIGDYVARSIDTPAFNYGRLTRHLGTRPGERLDVLPFASALGPIDENFARAIGASTSQAYVRPLATNESVGPRTVAAGRLVAERYDIRKYAGAEVKRKRLRLRQLTQSLGWNDIRYVGLDQALADSVTSHCRRRNDRFARRHWQCDWHDIFAPQSFEPNDVAVTGLPSGDMKEIEDVAAAVLEA